MDRLRTHIECLLDPGTAIEEKAQQGVIALSLRLRAVWLSQYGGYLVQIQRTSGRLNATLGGNAYYFGALCDSHWVAACDKGKEAAQGRQATIASPD
jgi:hypothetical protein